jgi:hypothetical protein
VTGSCVHLCVPGGASEILPDTNARPQTFPVRLQRLWQGPHREENETCFGRLNAGRSNMCYFSTGRNVTCQSFPQPR